MRIRTKILVVLTPLLAAVCLLIFFVAPSAYRKKAVQAIAVRSQSIAEMTAYSISPAIFFDDEDVITDVILSARQNKDLAYLVVFDPEGKRITAFFDTDENRENFDPKAPSGMTSEGRTFVARVPIVHQEDTLGELALGLSLDELRGEMKNIHRNILLFSFFLFLVGTIAIFSLSTLITRPLHKMSKTAGRIAAGDLTQRANVASKDEVGQLANSFNSMVENLQKSYSLLENAKNSLEKRVEDRTQELQSEIQDRLKAEEALQEANEKLSLTIQQLEQHNIEMALLSELGDTIQACNTEEEIYTLSAGFAKELFPGLCGALYELRQENNLFEQVLSWNENGAGEKFIEAQDCWALRRGKPHHVGSQGSSMICPHLKSMFPAPVPYLCIPLSAHGEINGLLHLHCPQIGTKNIPPVSISKSDAVCETIEQLAVNFGERVSLALSNLKLRNTLRQQSIRDPLTRLFNRRVMEESLEKEIYRAQRTGSGLGVIMLDIDFFKQFNEKYGHDAGDLMLEALSRFLEDNIRKGDIACRYGGEEFTLILPGTNIETAKTRAELLLNKIKEINIQYGNKPLGPINLSLGVSVFPTHGESGSMLLKAADEALLQAKREGRGRVAISSGKQDK